MKIIMRCESLDEAIINLEELEQAFDHGIVEPIEEGCALLMPWGSVEEEE